MEEMNSNTRQNPADQYLKHLNKFSHRISKPPVSTINKAPLNPTQQPPVYNIDKTQFKDVVQRLTGFSSTPQPLPAPIQSPRSPNSRLQRIRPPPLNYSSPAMSSSLHTNPPVHPVAESPISAYMRYLQTSTPTPTTTTTAAAQNPMDSSNSSSSLFSSQNSSAPPWQNFPMPPSPTSMLPNSPRSPYPLLSPNSFFSPTMGQWGFPQFTQSPKLSVLSPR